MICLGSCQYFSFACGLRILILHGQAGGLVLLHGAPTVYSAKRTRNIERRRNEAMNSLEVHSLQFTLFRIPLACFCGL